MASELCQLLQRIVGDDTLSGFCLLVQLSEEGSAARGEREGADDTSDDGGEVARSCNIGGILQKDSDSESAARNESVFLVEKEIVLDKL
jgi:hypothetical protein